MEFECMMKEYQLVCEAITPLRYAFGESIEIAVSIRVSEEDEAITVTVILPADFDGDPEAALQTFDKVWWLHNCHRSEGTLTFDYTIASS